MASGENRRQLNGSPAASPGAAAVAPADHGDDALSCELEQVLLYNPEWRAEYFVLLARGTVYGSLAGQFPSAVQTDEDDARAFRNFIERIERDVDTACRDLSGYIANIAAVRDIFASHLLRTANTAESAVQSLHTERGGLHAAMEEISRSLRDTADRFRLTLLGKDDYLLSLAEHFGNRETGALINPEEYVSPPEPAVREPRIVFYEDEEDAAFWDRFMREWERIHPAQSGVDGEGTGGMGVPDRSERGPDAPPELRGRHAVGRYKVMTTAEAGRKADELMKTITRMAGEGYREAQREGLKFDFGKALQRLQQFMMLHCEQFTGVPRPICYGGIKKPPMFENRMKNLSGVVEKYSRQIASFCNQWTLRLFDDVEEIAHRDLPNLRTRKDSAVSCFIAPEDAELDEVGVVFASSLHSKQDLQSLSDAYLLDAMPDATARKAVSSQRPELYRIVKRTWRKICDNRPVPIREYSELKSFYHASFDTLTAAINAAAIEGPERGVRILKDVFILIVREQIAHSFLELQTVYPRLSAPATEDRTKDELIRALLDEPERGDAEEQKEEVPLFTTEFLCAWWCASWKDFLARNSVQNPPNGNTVNVSPLLTKELSEISLHAQQAIKQSAGERPFDGAAFRTCCASLRVALRPEAFPETVQAVGRKLPAPRAAWSRYFDGRIAQVEEHLVPLLPAAARYTCPARISRRSAISM